VPHSVDTSVSSTDFFFAFVDRLCLVNTSAVNAAVYRKANRKDNDFSC